MKPSSPKPSGLGAIGFTTTKGWGFVFPGFGTEVLWCWYLWAFGSRYIKGKDSSRIMGRCAILGFAWDVSTIGESPLQVLCKGTEGCMGFRFRGLGSSEFQGHGSRAVLS